MNGKIPGNICMIRLSALGDAVHALALANGLRHGFPQAKITWIIQKLPHELVRNQPVVDRFILFDRKGGWRELRRLRKEMAGEIFDLVITPQVSAKASLVTLVTPGRIKLGFDFARSREFHWMVTNRRLPRRPAQHVQDQYLEFLDYLGVKGYTPRWDFVFTPEEIAWREMFFGRFDRPVAAFVPASSNPQKDWDVECYAEVMDHVNDHLGLQPVIVGGPSRREREMVRVIQERCRCAPVDGLEGPVRHTMLQLSGSRVVVAPDTGPLHIAVAMGVPTVSLYGYSNPRRCGPYRRFQELLIDAFTDPEDRDGPINRNVKPGRMDRIAPADVIEKLEIALETYPER